MKTIALSVLQLVFAAFANAFVDWLKDRQSNADAKTIGSLNGQLATANAEIEMYRDEAAIRNEAKAMTDDQAVAEAMKWAKD